MTQFYATITFPCRLLTLCLCLFGTGLMAQSAGNTTIETQADLDAFVDGNGDKFIEVDGNLVIEPTASLTDFSNLSDLVTITGNLEIVDYGANSVTQSEADPISTFGSLTTVEGNVLIEDSPGVTAIVSGTLANIGGDLELNTLSNLTGLFAIANLSVIGDNFQLSAVAELTGFSLPLLTTIGGDIDFENNPDLTALEGLAAVTSVGGAIIFRNNDSLGDVSDLGGEDGARLDIQNLIVANNQNLTGFGPASQDFRVRVLNILEITNNPNLQTVGNNIEAGIGGGVDQNLTSVNISGNSNFSGTTGLTSVAPIFDKSHPLTVVEFRVVNNRRLGFGGAPFGAQRFNVTNTLEVSQNPLIEGLPNFVSSGGNGTNTLSGNLIISDNTSLLSLSELAFITLVTGDIGITSNDDLADLDAFTRLTQAGSITISANASITSLDDFQAVSLNVDVTFIISNNDNLGDCCAPTCTTTVAGAQFDGTNPAVTINNNTGDCEDKPTLVAACQNEPGGDCLNPAPVDLVAFSAAYNGENAVDVTWSTATEEDNDFFEVQRSVDGANFEVIGTVTGAGNYEGLLDYSFADYSFAEGVSYYRLRQVDFDGAFEYSPVQAVEIGDAGAAAVTLFPNPSNGNDINVTLTPSWETADVTVRVYTAGGQMLSERLSSGTARIQLPTNDLAPGLYAVQISDGKQTTTERLVVR